MGQQKTKRRKTTKGEISITNSEGVIRLRWRYEGTRYSLNLPYHYTDFNLPKASICAAQIKMDIFEGKFDRTLSKYRLNGTLPEKIPTNEKKVNQSPETTEQKGSPAYPTVIKELICLFDQWATTIRNVNPHHSAKYASLRSILVKWGNSTIDTLPSLLAKENWSPSTYNGRLGYYKIFLAHLTKKLKIANNPLDDVTRRKNPRKANPKREAMTDQEIITFLEAIRTDRFCSKCSSTKHSFYYPFFYFIFATGVRNAEAIGLRVKHVNINEKIVEISETFARTSKGTNHAARVRKGTKTENTRFLPLSTEIITLIMSLIEGKGREDLIFLSPRGVSIDDRKLQKRILKPVMMALGYGNKDLYVARHSFGTRAINQGMMPTSIAYLMGHGTIQTVMQNYVSIAKSSGTLPNLNP